MILSRSTRAAAGAILLGFALAASTEDAARDSVEVGSFSRLAPGAELPDWQPLTFRKITRKTEYTLVRDEATTVVEAKSEAAASGLVRNLSVDLKQFPLLQWRWKVGNTIAQADPSKKAGDDYPARIYITFAYDRSKLSAGERMKYGAAKMLYGEYPPLAAINYIWEGKTPAGTALPNAYTERVVMIVVESGEQRLNQWLTMERNVYEDYKRAFGAEPPLVSGVAIMTDTDNTGARASARYGDISFRRSR